MHLLSTLYRIQSKSGQEQKMRDFLCAWIAQNCSEAKVEVDQKGNVYITKGESGSYPVIVAHMDLVNTWFM